METITIKCLWCGKDFDWDAGMYRFCDECVRNIELIESKIAKRVIIQDIEMVLMRVKGGD